MSLDLTRWFPIQGGLVVPRVAAARAYETYARLFGRDQSLEDIARRRGFGLFEFVALYRGWNPVIRRVEEHHVAEVLAEVFPTLRAPGASGP